MWNKSRWTDIRKPWLPQPCLALWVSNLVRRSHFCVPFLHPPPFWSPSPQAWAEETNSHHPPLERFLAPTLFLVFTPKLCYIPGESGSPLWSQTGRSSQWLWPQLRIQCSGSQEPGKGTQEVGCCGLLGIIFYLDTRRPCCSLASSQPAVVSILCFIFPKTATGANTFWRKAACALYLLRDPQWLLPAPLLKSSAAAPLLRDVWLH